MKAAAHLPPRASARGASRRPRTLVTPTALAALVIFACAPDQQIERPAPLYGEVPIDYPLELWDQDVEGQTLLRVRVTDTGRVDSVQVLESSGHPAFDSAAIVGARDLRFRPARKGGKRIEVWAEVPVHFSKRPRPDTALFF